MVACRQNVHGTLFQVGIFVLVEGQATVVTQTALLFTAYNTWRLNTGLPMRGFDEWHL